MLNNNIAKVYVSLIKKGLKTVDQVPASIKEQVKELLGENGDK